MKITFIIPIHPLTTRPDLLIRRSTIMCISCIRTKVWTSYYFNWVWASYLDTDLIGIGVPGNSIKRPIYVKKNFFFFNVYVYRIVINCLRELTCTMMKVRLESVGYVKQ